MRRVSRPGGIPVYIDGELEILEVTGEQTNGIYQEKLISTGEKIRFEQLAIYDRTRMMAAGQGVELTMKLRIPPTNFDRNVKVRINGEIHEVQNATGIIDSRDGFQKTELTLMKGK